MQVDNSAYQAITYQGHGMLERASSFNAQAHVVNHERHHLQHFESVARATGKEVVSENISIQYRFVDGKLIPVKGEATAVLQEKSAGNDTLELSNRAADKSVNSDPSAKSDSDQQTSQKINQIKNRIETQLEKIQNKIDDLKNQDDSDPSVPGLENKARQLEAAIAKINNLKIRSEAENQTEDLKGLLDDIGKALMSPEKLLEAIMGAKTGNEKPEKDNPSPDAVKISDKAYNRNMDYSLQALAMSAAWVA